jgi:hypothetical protein
MNRVLIVAFVIVAIIMLVGVIGALPFNLSAINEPSRTETYLATQAKHFLVRRVIVLQFRRPLTFSRGVSRKPTNCMVWNAAHITG